MLSWLGFLMVAVFMYAIMSKRLSALVALIVVPVVFALIGGFTDQLGEMMLAGIKQIAPTGIMLLFAILCFGIMMDAGLFDPLIAKILKIVKGDPLKIVVGTAILASLVALDGDGTTTYMITVTAMLPLYQRLGIKPMILARLQQTLQNYQEFRQKVREWKQDREQISQAQIDELIARTGTKKPAEARVIKGIDQITLDKISGFLLQTQEATTELVSKETGISRRRPDGIWSIW